MAVEQRFADANATALGDTIVFRGSDEEWEVVGIVFQPYALISPLITDVTTPIRLPDGVVYVTYEDGQAIGHFPGLSSFSARYATVDDAKEDLDNFLGVISSETALHPGFELH